MIIPSDRKQAVVLIDEAHSAGARKSRACEEFEISIRTYQGWVDTGFDDGRTARIQKPKNKLSKEERQAVIDCCNTKENQSLSPKQIVPRLADEGEFLASESTFYRI